MPAPIRLAAVQVASPFFDKAAGVEKACAWIAEAGRAGASLAAFGESWLPGYPFFIDAAPDARWWAAAAELAANAVEIPGPETDALCAAAAEAGVDVVIGVTERERAHGTLWCTLLFISREGHVLGRHRKLKPTHNERAVWGDGDAQGLTPYPRDYGRLSGLNCWEHNIMLPGFALVAQGVDVHVAAWPGREPDGPPTDPVWARQLLLSRAFASQAACYVVCAAGLRRFEDEPERLRGVVGFEHNGRSAIVDPWGEVIAGPLDGEGLLLAELDPVRLRQAKLACDAAGHYSRPDLFEVRLEGRTLFGGR